MAQGDVSEGDVLEIMSGDTYRVQFTQGARAGSTWRVRDEDIDTAERVGRLGFEGQGAIKRVQELMAADNRRVEVTEEGLDQFGRIVAQVKGVPSGDNYSVTLKNEGYGPPGVETTSGTTLFISFDPRRPGEGFGGDLVIDTTQP